MPSSSGEAEPRLTSGGEAAAKDGAQQPHSRGEAAAKDGARHIRRLRGTTELVVQLVDAGAEAVVDHLALDLQRGR